LGLLIAAVSAAGAFALPEFKLSAGAGGYFTSDFGGGVEVSGGGTTIIPMKIPYAGGGGFAFLDATYAELSLGFFVGGGEYNREIPDFQNGGIDKSNRKLSITGLDIGLLGKFPIAIGEKLSVFPLLGITYRAVLSAKIENANLPSPGDLSALWFKGGGGLDFSLTDKLYLRGDLLYGLRLANKAENDSVKEYSDFPGADAKALLGHGLEVKFAVGYRL
jgi:hypothetical protein